MEKRIKTLYIVTIVAILAFLGMQAYWLYGRYEFSLGEYDAQAVQTIVDAVADLTPIVPAGQLMAKAGS